MAFQLNLIKYFELIGRDFVLELRQAILKQTDLAGNRFSVINQSTAWKRFYARNKTNFKKRLATQLSKGKLLTDVKKKKGKNTWTYPVGVALNRLLFTKVFVNNAYQSKAKEDQVRIFASTKNYIDPNSKTKVSYADIVSFNCKGSNEVNPNIVDPPLIFPTTQAELRAMKSWKTLEQVHIPNMKKEIVRQIKTQAVKQVINIQL